MCRATEASIHLDTTASWSVKVGQGRCYGKMAGSWETHEHQQDLTLSLPPQVRQFSNKVKQMLDVPEQGLLEVSYVSLPPCNLGLLVPLARGHNPVVLLCDRLVSCLNLVVKIPARIRRQLGAALMDFIISTRSARGGSHLSIEVTLVWLLRSGVGFGPDKIWVDWSNYPTLLYLYIMTTAGCNALTNRVATNSLCIHIRQDLAPTKIRSRLFNQLQ